MTNPDRRQSAETEADARSDIQQAVDARRDALERGEGGDGDSPDAMSGEGGADGVVKNQDDAAQ